MCRKSACVWLTYGSGVERQSVCIHKAFDVGIDFIDTAVVYGRGAAESLLGEVCKVSITRLAYLATKVYFDVIH